MDQGLARAAAALAGAEAIAFAVEGDVVRTGVCLLLLVMLVAGLTGPQRPAAP